ncbi:hypothetical protein ABTK11_19720, partial [Acinetobacter baumannii]
APEPDVERVPEPVGAEADADDDAPIALARDPNLPAPRRFTPVQRPAPPPRRAEPVAAPAPTAPAAPSGGGPSPAPRRPGPASLPERPSRDRKGGD